MVYVMKKELDKYIGLPYVPMGTDPKDGLDCYHLIKTLYSEFFGVELPSLIYYPNEEKDAKEMLNLFGLMHEVSLHELKFGDVVGMRTLFSQNIALHVGMVVDRQRIIHTSNKGVVISEVEALKPFILGVYRLKND